MSDRVKTQLGIELEVMDRSNSWTDDHLVLGAVAIVKFIDPDGDTGFQIMMTTGDLNVAEKLGMAGILDTYMADQMELAMYPGGDEDDDE